MVSAKTINVIGGFFALLSFVFLLLVNLGVNVIQSIYIMKYELNNIVVKLGIYGSDCIEKGFKCSGGGLVSDIGGSGTKFLTAMHPIGKY